MEFPEKNNFVVKHTSAEYFDADKKLFKKIYPDSRLIPELERATQYNKEHLDGRMLLQMLNVVCGETILENRGVIHDQANQAPAPAPAADQSTTEPDVEESVDIPEKPKKSTRKKKAVPKKSIQA